MILAAGFGTRLKPWTLEHPKALVPVDGIPMLERVILKLKSQGFDEIVVNVHHFAGQITDFLDSKDFGIKISISDERGGLLDTGGGLVHARHLLEGEPFLVHNVDILSNADLSALMHFHESEGNDVTLLTSDRKSSRKLLFDEDGSLKGWHNLADDEYRPAVPVDSDNVTEEAFSGIYIIGKRGMEELGAYGCETGRDSFPVMDFFLACMKKIKIRRKCSADLRLLDIGKPETLVLASQFTADDL